MAKKIVGTINKNIIKAGSGLLDVNYTVRQLSEKLSLNPRYIRRALVQKRGAPHTKDETGHILINGKTFFNWAKEIVANEEKQKNKNPKLKDDEFYCVKCRTKITGINVFKFNDGHNDFLKGICPFCGTRINKYLKGRNDKEIDEK